GRAYGRRKEGDAAAAEGSEQGGLGVFAGGVPADAVVETARDQQTLLGTGRGAEQRGAQGAECGGKAGLRELLAAQAKDPRLRRLAGRADEAFDRLDPARLGHGAGPQEQEPWRPRFFRRSGKARAGRAVDC